METKKMQNQIMRQMTSFNGMSMNATAHKKGMDSLHLLWAELLKQNQIKRIEIKSSKKENTSWRQIAADNMNEIKLLKQQISKIRSGHSQATPTANEDDEKQLQNEQMQKMKSKLQQSMSDQSKIADKLKAVESENAMLKQF